MPTLTGTLRHLGRPIQVSITLEPQSAPFRADTYIHSAGPRVFSTDASGEFSIDDVPAGRYRMSWTVNGERNSDTFTLPDVETSYDVSALLDTGAPDPGEAWVNEAAQALADAAAAQADATEALDRLNAVQFHLTASGLTISITAGTLTFSDGQSVAVSAGSVTVFDSRTNYIGVRIHDQTWHALRARLDGGTVFVGEVVVSGGVVTAIRQYPVPAYPIGRVERFKAAMQHASHGLVTLELGNSLVDGTYGWTATAYDAVFSSSSTPTTYQIPNAADLTRVRRQYGGQKSRDALALGFGHVYRVLEYGQRHSAAVLVGEDVLTRESVSGAYYTRAEGALGVHLVVVTDYLNAGRENMFFLETICREARAAGAEVLWVIDNDKLVEGTIWGDLDTFAAIANTHGAALADVASYMEETKLLGTTVHSDSQHPNSAGVQIYAKTIRGVLCNYPLPAAHEQVIADGRVAYLDNPSYYPNRVLPRRADVQVDPAETTGSWGATAIGSSSTYYSKIPGKLWAGKSDSNCCLLLDSGEYAHYAHPFALGMDVIVETSNPSFSLQLQRPGGTLYSTLSPGADSAAVKLYELAAANFVGAETDPTGSESSGSPFRNVSIRLQCSSGTARVLGVVFYTVPHVEIPRSALRLSGYWLTEAAVSDAVPALLYTDSLGSEVTFEFVGTGCIACLQAHNAAGRVSTWYDGRAVHTDHELYTSASGMHTRSLLIAPDLTRISGGAGDLGYGRHTVRIKFSALHGSAGSVGTDARRVKILGIHAIDTR